VLLLGGSATYASAYVSEATETNLEEFLYDSLQNISEENAIEIIDFSFDVTDSAISARSISYNNQSITVYGTAVDTSNGNAPIGNFTISTTVTTNSFGNYQFVVGATPSKSFTITNSSAYQTPSITATIVTSNRMNYSLSAKRKSDSATVNTSRYVYWSNSVPYDVAA
jgi:hypothetical protein